MNLHVQAPIASLHKYIFSPFSTLDIHERFIDLKNVFICEIMTFSLFMIRSELPWHLWDYKVRGQIISQTRNENAVTNDDWSHKDTLINVYSLA